MNKTLLVGRIVNQELKITELKNNVKVLYFNIAINEFKNKQPKVSYIPVKAFNRSAEYIAKNFNKGDLVSLEAMLNVESIEKNNEWKTYWSLVVSQIKRLSKGTTTKTEEISISQKEIPVEITPNEESLATDNDAWELDF